MRKFVSHINMLVVILRENDEFNNLMQQMINFVFVELWKNYADETCKGNIDK